MDAKASFFVLSSFYIAYYEVKGVDVNERRYKLWGYTELPA